MMVMMRARVKDPAWALHCVRRKRGACSGQAGPGTNHGPWSQPGEQSSADSLCREHKEDYKPENTTSSDQASYPLSSNCLRFLCSLLAIQIQCLKTPGNR